MMQCTLNLARLGDQVGIVFPADNQHGGILVGNRGDHGFIPDAEGSTLKVLDERDELMSVHFSMLGGCVGRRRRQVRTPGRRWADIGGTMIFNEIISFNRYQRQRSRSKRAPRHAKGSDTELDWLHHARSRTMLSKGKKYKRLSREEYISRRLSNHCDRRETAIFQDGQATCALVGIVT